MYRLDQSNQVDFAELGHEELLYGIYLAVQEKNYEKGELWLRQWEKQNLLHTDKTVKIISYFTEKKKGIDKTPRTVAIRLHLLLNLLSDPLYPLTDEKKKELMKLIQADFACYMMQGNHVFPFALSEEQIQEIRNLVTEPSCALPEVLPSFTDWDIFNLTQEGVIPKQKINFAMRPGKAMVENFFHYYRLVKEQDGENPQLQELRFILKGTQDDPSKETQACRTILLGALENPDFFPSVEELLLKKEFYGTTAKVMEELHFRGSLFRNEKIPAVLNKIIQPQEIPPLLNLVGLVVAFAFLIMPSSYFFGFGALCQQDVYFHIFSVFYYLRSQKI